MTPNEFRTILANSGLTQIGFSRLMLVDKTTVTRWAMGKTPLPRSVEFVLRALDYGWTTPEQLTRLGEGLDREVSP